MGSGGEGETRIQGEIFVIGASCSLAVTNWQSPITNPQLPITNPQLPMPHAPCPMPYSQSSIPSLLFYEIIIANCQLGL